MKNKKKKVFIKIETGLHYVFQETNSNQHKNDDDKYGTRE
jgi:hypothetical protein